MKKEKKLAIMLTAVIVICAAVIFALKPHAKSIGVEYADQHNWMYYGAELADAGKKAGPSAGRAGRDVDVFFIAPTSTLDGTNADITDGKTRAAILNATNMEIGIYCDNALVYAPYYRMATLADYDKGGKELEDALDLAYIDVKTAFDHYLTDRNHDRPILLAGFSQGADMIYRLMEDEFTDEEMQQKLVAAYAIGWPCTQEMTEKYPQLRMAEAEDDTGVIVSFECESERLDDSLIVPKGVRMLSINPLNWTTTPEKADKELNRGFVYVDGSSYTVKSEISNFCGGYIDETRGTLKVPELREDDYPSRLSFLKDGSYHIYDYQFFYRNLQENAAKRISAYWSR